MSDTQILSDLDDTVWDKYQQVFSDCINFFKGLSNKRFYFITARNSSLTIETHKKVKQLLKDYPFTVKHCNTIGKIWCEDNINCLINIAVNIFKHTSTIKDSFKNEMIDKMTTHRTVCEQKILHHLEFLYETEKHDNIVLLGDMEMVDIFVIIVVTYVIMHKLNVESILYEYSYMKPKKKLDNNVSQKRVTCFIKSNDYNMEDIFKLDNDGTEPMLLTLKNGFKLWIFDKYKSLLDLTQ